MTTVSKKIALDIIAGKYDDDHPTRIVKYTNKWGNEAFGVTFKKDDINKYHASEFVINPEIYWEK